MYLWQSALARLTAAVLVVGCTHSTCALVLDQWRDLRRVHSALEARNECSKTQKRNQSASDSVVYPWQSALARLATAVSVVGCTNATPALILDQCRDVPREHGALEARNECSKTRERYQSASDSVAYPWQSARARLAAAVLVVGCSHLARALFMDECGDLPRVHSVIEARNECSKTQKWYHSASHSLVYPWQSALARLATAVSVVGYTNATRALILDQCRHLPRAHGALEARNECSKTRERYHSA